MEQMLIKELIETAMQQLRNFGLRVGTLKSYKTRAFHQIETFFRNRNADSYEAVLIEELRSLYKSQLETAHISQDSFNWRIRGLEIVTEIYQTGSFEWKVFTRTQKFKLPDYFDGILAEFIASLECSPKRISIYESVTRRFITYLLSHGNRDFSLITEISIRNFLIDISTDKPKSMDDVITVLGKFFIYLKEKNAVERSYYSILAAPRSRDRKVYPALLPEDFNQMLGCIDLGSAMGKRDYAVLMLAATTGLRCGDLVSLRLSDIDWRRKEIRIIQGKTQKPLILPLDKNAGDSLADYLLNGRPASVSKNIFIRNCAPYNEFHDGVSVACIFRKYLKAAGIIHQTGDGKTMHGVRRMLGTEMTATGIPVTTVSQILGHKDMSTAKQYISLDITGLRKCTLEFDSLRGASI